jgi:hypothetical protein
MLTGFRIRCMPSSRLDAYWPGETCEAWRNASGGPAAKGGGMGGRKETRCCLRSRPNAQTQRRPFENPGFRLPKLAKGPVLFRVLRGGVVSIRGEAIMSNESKRNFRGEQVAVRLEPELRRTIEELARKDRRSLSGYLHNIIADAVAEQAGTGAAA